MSKARAKTSARAVEKLARLEGGRLRFEMRPPELVPLSEHHGYRDTVELSRALVELMGRYFDSLPYDRRFLLNRYRYQDAAQKVVGVGSVGTRAWAVLLAGKDADDPLVMQVKEAQQSVVERFWRPSGFAHAGSAWCRGSGSSNRRAISCWLDERREPPRRAARLLRAAAVERQGLDRPRGHWRGGAALDGAPLRLGARALRMRARATAWPSRRIWGSVFPRRTRTKRGRLCRRARGLCGRLRRSERGGLPPLLREDSRRRAPVRRRAGRVGRVWKSSA